MAMHDRQRFKLRFGRYRTPRFKYKSIVWDEVRGFVEIVGVTDARIPWPLGKRHRAKPSPVVFRDLAKAVRNESNQAVAHWWGVSGQTVTKWRKGLDVEPTNRGTSVVRSEQFHEDWASEARKKAWAKARDPVRRAKIAASRLGKKRPVYVVAAMRRALKGRRHSAETRRRMSEAHRRRGTRPPMAGPAWTAREEALLYRLPPREVARRTGRSLAAVYVRRSRLGRPHGPALHKR